MNRRKDVVRFYALLDRLGEKVGGKRVLGECSGYLSWPNRGLNFFFEDGETRSGTGKGMRVVRVGTHALQEGSRATLWQRLKAHRGTNSTGGGNHRGSIFRLLVGSQSASHEQPQYEKRSSQKFRKHGNSPVNELANKRRS